MRGPIKNHWIAGLTAIAGSLIQINTDILSEELFSINSIPRQIMIYSAVYVLIFLANEAGERKPVNMPVSGGGTNDGLISCFFGLLLACSFVLGANLERHDDIFTGNGSFVRIGLRIIGLGIVLASLWFICLKYYKRYLGLQLKVRRLGSIQLFVIIFCITIVVWMPALIKGWPGILYGDSYNEIYQALGVEQLSTHHPLCHVLFLKLCIIVSHGNIYNAIAIYSVSSVLIVATILADVITILLKRGVSAVATCIFVALIIFPSTPFLSMSILKDMLFAAFFVLYLLCVFDMVINRADSRTDRRQKIRLIIATIGVAITRKNGIYIIGLTVAFYLLYLLISKKQEKRHFSRNLRIIAAVGTFGIMINIFIEGYLGTNIIGARAGDHKEALSIPIQQLARISQNIELTDDERDEINSFFVLDDEDIGDYYYPLISDSAKGKFNNGFYEKNKKYFFLLSARMLIKYPAESLEGILNTCYGYWFPTRINWFYAYSDGNNDYNKIIQEHAIPYPSTITYEYYENAKNLPGLSILMSIGTTVWILVFFFSVAISEKIIEAKLLYIPIFSLWLTCVASPVWNELRYALGLFWAVPLAIEVIQVDKRRNSIERSSKTGV